jgi:hypothetical protein
LPKPRITQGSVMAITVATEQAANSESETAMATSASPHRRVLWGRKLRRVLSP